MLSSGFIRIKSFLWLMIIIIQICIILIFRIVIIAKNIWYLGIIASLKDICLIHDTLCMLICNFLLEFGQFFLDIRVNITLPFQRATG